MSVANDACDVFLFCSSAADCQLATHRASHPASVCSASGAQAVRSAVGESVSVFKLESRCPAVCGEVNDPDRCR